MGGRTNRVRGHPLPGAPVVRIKGYGMWGGVEVKSRRPREDAEASIAEHLGRAVGRIGGPPMPPMAPLPPPPIVRGPHGRSRDRDRERAPGRERQRDRYDRRHGEPLRAERSKVAAPTGVVTIVCTDIVGSTRLADTMGDQRWRDLLGAHNTIVREHLARYAGTEVKTSGDGFLVAFASARSAVGFALDVRDAVGRLDLELRVGLHAGEVERDGDDIVGRNVSLTFRLCDAAAPGEVLVSAMVADLADSSSDLSFGDRRELSLAGIDRPILARLATRRQ
jgi:class 3 adenylate cyclase